MVSDSHPREFGIHLKESGNRHLGIDNRYREELDWAQQEETASACWNEPYNNRLEWRCNSKVR